MGLLERLTAAFAVCSKCHRGGELERCNSCGARLCHSWLGKAIVAQEMSGISPVRCLSCGHPFW